MEHLLSIFGFLSVVVRGAVLIFEALTIGGAVFLSFVAPPLSLECEAVHRSLRRWLAWSAVALAIAQAASISNDLLALVGSTGMSLREAAGADFVYAGGLAIVAAAVISALCFSGRPLSREKLLIPAAFILLASVMTSHAVARLDHRVPLALLTALHQCATAAWIGGLPYLWLTLRRASDAGYARQASRRFSKLAMGCVAVLAASGLTLGVAYIGSWATVYGTSYGAMVTTKALLLVLLLALGALNYGIVRDMRPSEAKGMRRLHKFAEAEIGIGLTVILAAASLTSLPPAADFVMFQVPGSKIIARMTPQSPRLKTPSVQDMSTAVAESDTTSPILDPWYNSDIPGVTDPPPRDPNAIAWSEYNHHWAGLVVLLMGLLALAARIKTFSWTKHWPLMFLGLAAFLFFRADPENWPLGPHGFWQSFADPEVLQHRIVVLLISAFAISEWRVQTLRARSQFARLIFPAICAAGSALLLTHSHSLGNVTEEFLAELSHLPIAILGVAAGWSRWLEIRLPGDDRLRPLLSRVWPVCFALIGAILLNYREG